MITGDSPYPFPSLARTLTYSCPVLQYTTMLVVPTTPTAHPSLTRSLGPVRGDHALFSYDPNCKPLMRALPSPATPCWSQRPLSLHFEPLPNQPRPPTPRRAPSPVRMSTNPRVRRRSTEPPGPQPPPPPPQPLVWPTAVASPDPGRPAPMKTRPARRSSGAKEMLQLLKRSAKKKMDRLRRSMSAERLSGSQRSRSSILRCEDDEDRAAQRRRVPAQGAEAADVFPCASLLCIHQDGSHTVRLVRQPEHAFGFFVSLDRDQAYQSMFISRMAHRKLEERLAGLLDVGDELLSVENIPCATLTLEQLQLMVSSRLAVHLRVMPRPFL